MQKQRGGPYGTTHYMQVIGSISTLAQAYLTANTCSWRKVDEHSSIIVYAHNGQLGDCQVNEDGDITVISTGIRIKVRDGQARTIEE